MSQQSDLVASLERLRCAVAALGEANRWWRSTFLTPTGFSFLQGVSPRTFAAAAIRAASEAARLEHDARVGRGKVVHLFRLPPALERAIDDALRGMDVSTQRARREALAAAGGPMNLLRYGTDIDPRACQIAALALWLRAQRTYQRLGLKGADRPRIAKTNIVCAEPMPGEPDMVREFLAGLQPRLLGQLVEVAVQKMRLAGEAGSFFFLSSFQKWREEILLKEARPTVVANLGQGVLDTAMVETAVYCLQAAPPRRPAI